MASMCHLPAPHHGEVPIYAGLTVSPLRWVHRVPPAFPSLSRSSWSGEATCLVLGTLKQPGEIPKSRFVGLEADPALLSTGSVVQADDFTALASVSPSLKCGK
jgi:hypothetical protein